MAKESVTIAPPAVEAGKGGDSRSVMIEVPMTDGSKKSMSRSEYCWARYQAGVDVATIRKEVVQLQGKDVPYQTIYQATKGRENKQSKGSASDAAPASGEGEGAVS